MLGYHNPAAGLSCLSPLPNPEQVATLSWLPSTFIMLLPPWRRAEPGPGVPPRPPHLIGARLQPEALDSGMVPNWMSPHYEIFARQANREAGIRGRDDIFLFIPGGGCADKSSHSIHSPGTEAERRPSQTLGRL